MMSIANMGNMKIIPICPCPWCKCTPDVWIMEGTGETWIIDIRCNNCKIKPCSFYVSIRNAGKKDPIKIEEKIRKVFSFWNEGNPITATEGKQFDFDEISIKGFPFTNQSDVGRD